MKKERIEYIDTAKGILMLLVVIGHIQEYAGTYGYLYRFIYAFHMPAFFLISGILINKDNWKTKLPIKFVIGRIKHLIIPYVFFETIGIILYQFIYFEKESVIQLALKSITIHCNVGADWYLIAFFMASILYYFYLKIENKYLAVTIVIFSIIYNLFIATAESDHFLWVIGRCFIGVSLLITGSALKKYFMNIRTRFIFVSFVLTMISAYFNNVNVAQCCIGNPIIFAIGSLSGTYFILGISKYFQCKALNYIGMNTITILGTHQFIIYIYSWFIGSTKSITILLTIFILVCVCEAALIPLLNKLIPKLVGK